MCEYGSTKFYTVVLMFILTLHRLLRWLFKGYCWLHSLEHVPLRMVRSNPCWLAYRSRLPKKHLCQTQIFLDHQHDYYYYAKYISVGNKIISIHLNARARGHSDNVVHVYIDFILILFFVIKMQVFWCDLGDVVDLVLISANVCAWAFWQCRPRDVSIGFETKKIVE